MELSQARQEHDLEWCICSELEFLVFENSRALCRAQEYNAKDHVKTTFEIYHIPDSIAANQFLLKEIVCQQL